MRQVFFTRYREGRFTSKPLRDLLLAFGEDAIEVSIAREAEYPGPGSLRHYHGRLVPLYFAYLVERGHDKPGRALLHEDAHRDLCDRFLTRDEYDPATDTYKRSLPQLRLLTREQMARFLAQVERFLFDELKIKGPGHDAEFIFAEV